ncbi:polymorphic toxin type 28 domain-containing protein, partial [Streptomyces sp. NPDC058239]|uniref:polymorphic toxin type 28 domain-containing protein n=1 Tax=Streptomyces sp. NPDC058239 TaxID=3346395 RepID=UPI0036EB8560
RIPRCSVQEPPHQLSCSVSSHPRPTLTGQLLGAAGFIPLFGDAAKLPKQLDNIADALKLANKIPTSQFSSKLDSISGHLQMSDLTAARRELQGEVVARKASGTPWDHVHEVRDAQNGLLKTIGSINKKLSHPKTSSADRDLLVADLGRASRMLDHSEQFVPRG